MEKNKTIKLDSKTKQVLAKFIRAARHARNLFMPVENGLTVEEVRGDAVEAESFAQITLGTETYREIEKIAFNGK